MSMEFMRVGLVSCKMFRLGIPLLLVLAVGGCGADNTPLAQAQSTPPITANVTLREWDVFTDKTTISAGQVTFNATNTGAVPHELVVLKLNAGVQPETMQVRGGVVDEAASGTVIDEIEDFTGTQTKTMTLTSGTYAIFCAIVENDSTPGKTKVSHYVNGMHAKLTVQ